MNALLLRSVVVRADGCALFEPLDVEVGPGTVTSVVGASGSGKTSLLAYLCGTLPAGLDASGRVQIGEQDLTDLAPERRHLGLLYQDPLLFPHLSVAGNLLFGLQGGGGQRTRRRQVEEALASMGLDGYGDRDPATLSGGQKSRIALLRVLLSEPRALLLDEPFSALDDANRDNVRNVVFAEVARRKLPALMVTHDQQDVAAAGGPVVELTPTQ